MDVQHSPSRRGWTQGGQGPFPGIGGPFGSPAGLGGSFANPAGLGGSFANPAGPGGSFANPAGFGGSFPGPTGFGDTFSGPPALINPTVLPPKSPAGGQGGLALPGKLADIKTFIDRMGGIDGVISGVSKFQKFVATMRQFGPLIRLFMGKGKGKVAAASRSRPVRRRKSRTGVRAKARTRSHRSGKRRH